MEIENPTRGLQLNTNKDDDNKMSPFPNKWIKLIHSQS